MADKKTNLEDISAVIGFTATLKLVAWFGDMKTVAVPTTAREGQPLVKVIGLANAQRISAEWGGEFLYIPGMQGYESEVKRRSVAMMTERGFSPKEIGVYLRMGDERVKQIQRELVRQNLVEKPPGKMGGKNGGQDSVEKTPGTRSESSQEASNPDLAGVVAGRSENASDMDPENDRRFHTIQITVPRDSAELLQRMEQLVSGGRKGGER